MADAFVGISPFNYADNSPIANFDLYGLQAVPTVDPIRAGLTVGASGGVEGFVVASRLSQFTGQAVAASTAVNFLKPVVQIGLPSLVGRSPSYIGATTTPTSGQLLQSQLATEQQSKLAYWEGFGSGVGNGHLRGVLSPITDIFASKYRADLANTTQGYNFWRSAGIRFAGTAKAQMALGAASLIRSSATAIAAQGGSGVNRIYSARELIRRGAEPGPFHNFPESFNETIFSKGTRTITTNYFNKIKPNLSNSNVLYELPGSINTPKGIYEGVYQIGVRPSVSGRTELIMHRFFQQNNFTPW